MSSPVIPVLRYHDAVAAIDWLVEAFGFERNLVVPGEGDTIAHAQLTFGSGMIMLGSKPGAPEDGGPDADGIYVVVSNVDAHADRARRAGAKILQEPKDEDYGGRGYTASDLEGKVWSFGSYDPWASVSD